jgi:putative aldouronate transport system permease protein
MFGLVMAFQDYRLKDGILGSEWVGLLNFKLIFSTKNLVKIILNTVRIGLLTVLVSFPFPVILAIMLNEVKGKRLKAGAQTILYLPHFFAWVVVGGIIINVFSFKGPINHVIKMFGGEPVGFLTNAKTWLGVYLGAGIWKEVGYDAIVYLAALTAIDPTYYEAAKIDGATKFQQITKITLPSLMPTIILMFIMATGKVMSVGFDRIYVLMNPAVADVANVVSVFSYEFGIRTGQYSIATAMGMFDSVVALILVLLTNKLAKKTDSALF